jgi:PAS domain S-box-containing protein
MSHAHALHPGDDCFRLAMNSSGIGMAIIGLDGTWREINPALEHMLGYRGAELIGRPAARWVHPDDAEHARAQTEALIDGRIATVDAPQRYLHRNGDTVWVHANAVVMRSPAGAPLYLLVQLRDTSAQRQAEAALRANAEQHATALEASNRQLQLFADAVSHDLRAPLRSIDSFSALLAERAGDALDETSRDYLARVRSAATRMGSLLAALSDLSYATRAELKPAAVDLSLIAEWVAAELQEAEPERSADMRVQPGLIGVGDERLLKLLLTELIGNAWKFSRECPQARIDVSGETGEDGALRLRVRDAGCGFDMRYAHKLFEPFQRLHGPEQGAGHGLGLAIAQRIVERHHGHLRAESTPGGGSTFHLELPAAPAP